MDHYTKWDYIRQGFHWAGVVTFYATISGLALAETHAWLFVVGLPCFIGCVRGMAYAEQKRYG